MLRYITSLTPDEALVNAKREIENAPLVTDDQDLYTPLFRNISIFKRLAWRGALCSCTLINIRRMSEVSECCAAERWRIVPGIVALPSRHTEEVRGLDTIGGIWKWIFSETATFSQVVSFCSCTLVNIRRMSEVFECCAAERWRIVPGIVALPCRHTEEVRGLDTIGGIWKWIISETATFSQGPYTLKDQEELSRNTIKTLCNADISEGIFVSGTDVSLPETTIRNPKRPRRNLGGKRVSQRPILAFFAGNMHGPVRPKLLSSIGRTKMNP